MSSEDIEGQPTGTPKVAPWRALRNRLSTLFGWLIKGAIAIFGGLFLFTLSFPPITLSLFFTGRMWCWTKHLKKWREESTEGTIYKKKARTKTTRNKIQRVSVVLATRLGMMALCWLILNLSVPHLGWVRFLGSPLWKWSLVLTVIFLLNPAMLFGSYILEGLLWLWSLYEDIGEDDDDDSIIFNLTKTHLWSSIDYLVEDEGDDEDGGSIGYWTRGVEHSARWVIYNTLILLVWIIFFFANHGEIEQMHQAQSKREETKQNPFPVRVHKYIILTLVSLLVGAIMGFVADLARLWWKSKYIYTIPTKVQILVTAFRLYLLLYIVNGKGNTLDPFILAILIPYYRHEKQWKHALNPLEAESREQLPSLRKDTPRIEKFMKKMSEVVSLSDIEEAAKLLTQGLDLTFHEIPKDLGSEFVRGVLDYYYGGGRTNISADDSSDQTQSNLPDEEAKPFQRKGIEMPELLLKLVRFDLGKSPTDTIHRKDFEDWMRLAHRRCFVYTNKLHGSLELANILSKVLAAFQIFAAVIFWLFITELATTKLILTLGSLFIGIVFIFGDTCKEAFRGFIFSFITHPFDVGDRVEIDGKRLEVEKIFVMITVFKMDDSPRDTVIYHNSHLANNLKITKLKNEGEANQIKTEGKGEAADNISKLKIEGEGEAADNKSCLHKW